MPALRRQAVRASFTKCPIHAARAYAVNGNACVCIVLSVIPNGNDNPNPNPNP